MRRLAEGGSRRRWPRIQPFAAVTLVALLAAMLLLPWMLDLDPLGVDASERFAKPGTDHLLGTDNLGRDLLARVLDGARVSLSIGIGSAVISAMLGVPLGMLAAWYRGPVDAVLSFVIDVMLAFPGLVLALALAAFLGPSAENVMIAVTVPMIPVVARFARAQSLRIVGSEYVEASRLIGTPPRSILRRHVFPNIADGIVAVMLVNVGRAVLIEGGLSFLGIGVPLPQPTWGGMINEGRFYLATDPLQVLVPATFLIVTIYSLNLVAERLSGDVNSRRRRDGGQSDGGARQP